MEFWSLGVGGLEIWSSPELQISRTGFWRFGVPEPKSLGNLQTSNSYETPEVSRFSRTPNLQNSKFSRTHGTPESPGPPTLETPELQFLGSGDLENWRNGVLENLQSSGNLQRSWRSGDLEFLGSGDLEFWRNGVLEFRSLSSWVLEIWCSGG